MWSGGLFPSPLRGDSIYGRSSKHCEIDPPTSSPNRATSRAKATPVQKRVVTAQVWGASLRHPAQSASEIIAWSSRAVRIVFSTAKIAHAFVDSPKDHCWVIPPSSSKPSSMERTKADDCRKSKLWSDSLFSFNLPSYFCYFQGCIINIDECTRKK